MKSAGGNRRRVEEERHGDKRNERGKRILLLGEIMKLTLLDFWARFPCVNFNIILTTKV